MKVKQASLTFDPSMQPGYQTRRISMDALVGPKIDPSYSGLETSTLDKRNLRHVFKTGQVPELLPSYNTRLKQMGKK